MLFVCGCAGADIVLVPDGVTVNETVFHFTDESNVKVKLLLKNPVKQ
jgi:hypothetical protein